MFWDLLFCIKGVERMSPIVGVVMGSHSDWETMRHACAVLEELGIPFEKKSCRRIGRRMRCFGMQKRRRRGALKSLLLGPAVRLICRG